MPRISVLTPTYNRAEKLERLYHAVNKSTYRDFEWIIMNDGSKDHTEEVIKKIQEESDFPVIYRYQENSGKHVAMNRMYEIAQGEYCFTIDDDDELLPETLAKGVAVIDRISVEDREKYWCIVGRCIDGKTGEFIGIPYPDNINELTGGKQKKALKVNGECCSFKKTSIMKKFKFPEVKGCSYFPEGNLWNRLDEEYKQYYTNEIFRVYYRNDGESLVNYSKNKESYVRRYNMYRFLLSEENPLKSKAFSRRHIAEIYKYRLFTDRLELSKKEVYSGISDFNKFVLWMSAIPCRMLQKKRKE